jgi:hypothetical protein
MIYGKAIGQMKKIWDTGISPGGTETNPERDIGQEILQPYTSSRKGRFR